MKKLLTILSLIGAGLLLVGCANTKDTKNNTITNDTTHQSDQGNTNTNVQNQNNNTNTNDTNTNNNSDSSSNDNHNHNHNNDGNHAHDHNHDDDHNSNSNEPQEKKYTFTKEDHFIEINKSYTDNELVNIELRNIDLEKFNVKYLIKYITSENYEDLETTSFNFTQKYNHSLVKAEVYKEDKLLYTSDEVLLYYKNKPTENNILTEEQQKQRKATRREIYKFVKHNQLLTAIDYKSALVKSHVDFPFPSIEKVNEYSTNKDVVMFENNEIENYLNSIYYVDLSKISLRTRGIQYPRMFTQDGIQGLQYLKNLEEIDLSNNTFSLEDVKEILQTLPNIKVIKLNSNRKITDFSTLSQYDIKELHLSRSSLTDAVLESIVTSFPNLEVLNISYNKDLTNLQSLSRLTKLKTLYIDNLNLDNLDELKTLTQLEKLSMVRIEKNLENNSKSLLENYEFLNSLTNLKFLDISSNKVSTFEFLNHTLKLNELRMASTQLLDIAKQGFANIKKLTKLTKFVANQSTLTIENLSLFGNLEHLTDLDLSNIVSINKIGFEKQNTSLRFINLSYTRLNDDETKFSFKNAIELVIKNTPEEQKQGDVEYYNTDEVTYFDGNNYIIDHVDHWHVHSIGNENNGFYRTDLKNYKLLNNYFLVGFNNEGFFLNSKIKVGRFGNGIYNIFYFEGFPEFPFDMPEYKDKSIKPTDEYLQNILNKKKEFVLTKEVTEEQRQEVEQIISSNLSLYEKINKLNKFYN